MLIYNSKFVSQEWFNQTKYVEDICIAISKMSGQFQSYIVKVVSMLLPYLAEGFIN